MWSTKKLGSFAALVACLVLFSSTARTEEVAQGSVRPNLDAQFEDAAHRVVRVAVLTQNTPADFVHAHSYGWGGDDLTPPRWIVGGIKITRGKEQLYVPLSAYADLGEPRSLVAEPGKDGSFTLTLKGGDAGGSYSARLEFNNGELASRKVSSGEFPKDAWEETHYTFNHRE